MKLCPVCKSNFIVEAKNQIFCGGGHCLEAFANRAIASSSNACPYCSESVFVDAVVCGKCNGILSIGSQLAINHALASDPTLSLKDKVTVKKLTDIVIQIDASLQEEEARVSAQINAQELEDERLWSEHLDQLSPFARFIEVNRRKVIASLAAVVSTVALTFAYILYAESNSIENYCGKLYSDAWDVKVCVRGYTDTERYLTDGNLLIMQKQGYRSQIMTSGFGGARFWCLKRYGMLAELDPTPIVDGCDRYFEVVPLVHHGQ